jgi:hypothetical protein
VSLPAFAPLLAERAYLPRYQERQVATGDEPGVQLR